ncbi:MAG: SRPBCC family protein [Acidimicrobiales bacterium]
MKYAESPGVASSVLIDAPPEQVWALVSDPMTPAQFENELVKAEWEHAPNGAELGATFRGFNHHPDLGWSWEVVCVINRYEEGRLFGWSAGEGESAAAQWWFTVVAEGDRTRLWFHSTMGPGPSGLTPAIEAQPDREDDIVANRLKDWAANMARTVEGIKGLAER